MNPSKDTLCRFLANINFNFSCIIDVGVLTQTHELLKYFKTTKQILIEPQKKYFPIIENNYKYHNFELLNLGCDKEPGEFYLQEKNVLDNMKGLPTHNQITKENTGITVKVDTLNNIAKGIDNWILLKIDVDGKEVDILKGAYDCLKKTAIVIIEAHFNRFKDIVDIKHEQNFVVFNIVDICYLKSSFWQCDLVFINNDVRNLHPEFNPSHFWKSKDSIFKHHYRQYAPPKSKPTNKINRNSKVVRPRFKMFN